MELSTEEKLKKLNQASIEKYFSLDDMDWTKNIDRKLKWSPDALVSITYLPSYNLLNQQQKLRYNQMFALSICEQFIWLENNLLRGVLIHFLDRPNLKAEFRQALKHFLEEEDKHSEMFWTLLERAEPRWYQERKFQIFQINSFQKKFFDMIVKFPQTFPVWIWMALFFEERTLDYSIRYQKAYQKQKGELEFNFWQVHYYHMLDEVRHHQMDEIFLENFYDNESPWKKKLTGWMFHKIMLGYISPKRNARVMLDKLGEEFQELKASVIPQLKSELPLLRQNAKFQEEYFGKKTIGRTLELMTRYPELDEIWDLFINQKKTDFGSKA